MSVPDSRVSTRGEPANQGVVKRANGRRAFAVGETDDNITLAAGPKDIAGQGASVAEGSGFEMSHAASLVLTQPPPHRTIDPSNCQRGHKFGHERRTPGRIQHAGQSPGCQPFGP